MRLDIGDILTPNNFLARSIARFSTMSRFFAAAVIAFAGIAFRIFVGQHAALGFENGFRDHIFRRNQFNRPSLALGFSENGFINGGILVF